MRLEDRPIKFTDGHAHFYRKNKVDTMYFRGIQIFKDISIKSSNQPKLSFSNPRTEQYLNDPKHIWTVYHVETMCKYDIW